MTFNQNHVKLMIIDGLRLKQNGYILVVVENLKALNL